MTYNVDSHIRSVEDVKAFFHYLVDDRKLNFHLTTTSQIMSTTKIILLPLPRKKSSYITA